MVFKLPPLEFTEALTDSPEFREKLRQHESELENTSNAIKTLIKKLNEVMVANKSTLEMMAPVEPREHKHGHFSS